MQKATVESSYVAISYEWGPECTRYIKLNDSIFAVRLNLHHFLYFARLGRANQCLWIDALSINQANVTEKNRQVRIMGEIFSSARHMLSFIPGDFPLYLAPCARQAPKEKTWDFLARVEHDSSLYDGFVNHCGSAWEDDSHEWNVKDITRGMVEFCQSSYWQRLWIIQEVVLARELIITDGVRLISWHTLQMVLQTVVRHAHQGKTMRQDLVESIPSRVDEFRTGSRRTSLIALLTDFGALNCANFRDRVYGLLSLAINRHYYPIDYDSTLVNHFFTTLQFCQRYGAYLAEEAELFSSARMICDALKIDTKFFENAALSGHVAALIVCNTVVSSFAINASAGVGSRKQPLLECRHCHFQTRRHPPAKGSTLFCLAAEGARAHLSTSSNSKMVEHRKRKAAIILTFPPGEDQSNAGELAERITDTVTIDRSPLASNSPYHRLCLTATGFLHILRYEHRNLDDILPRAQQLCIMSDDSLDGETASRHGEGL
jgi:hypothetical protein